MKDLLSILLLTTPAFISSQKYDVVKELQPLVERRKKQFVSHADACVSELGTSVGVAFLDCVLDKLEAAEQEYKQSNGENKEKDPFPVPTYTRHPLTIKEDYGDPANHPLMLMDFLRNYTCARDMDGGSPVEEEIEWIYDEEKVRTEVMEQNCSADEDDEGDASPWLTAEGYLPAGDDVGDHRRMGIKAAQVQCDRLPICEGFTFQKTSGDELPIIFFKGEASLGGVNKNSEWMTYVKKKKRASCNAPPATSDNRRTEEFAPPVTYKVEILRKDPLVAVIPNFAYQEDCDMLMEKAGSDEEMGRAHETNGPSSYRRSYSSNIDVDYENQTDPLTRYAERMFAFVRDITGYDLRGPGQEPINAVLYKDVGDEYRPHCDGPCHGELYRYGKRVATTILYCQVPDGGGQTSFTRSGMMVKPRPRDLLLFAYKHENGTMDNGFTEHSGCPITAGRKWITTQWYREGVDYDYPWRIMEDWGRN